MLKIKKNIAYRIILLTQFAIICFSLFQIVFAENTDLDIKEKEYSEKYIEWLNLPDEQKKVTIPPQMYVRNIETNSKPIRMYSVYLGLSSKYNLRDEMSSLKIKNQAKTEQCWAFSATTQLESYFQKNKNKNIEFSPRHIEYSTARTFLDGTNTRSLL